ncbi:HupE/UreJ family protein [Flavobacterium sp. NRK F10]|uniref:HupE / UreJ protein n=1 Tax=Flavobacterium sediminis TaxID=2201181 RepID=A0A2U8QTK1_9FLAO|nr:MULTISPECIES: HupE/UreJ family protein [Flavobacterium]AWM13409.1 HupE / UreJ protein [Flavobacterium sediminis]MCO6174526.1 HupE/UreJ family protein [Flavobacterium sp. NRK F10]
MSEFWPYFKIGLTHVLNIHAYDHVLFLTALMIPYTFKDWKRVLILVSLFTLGHTLSLFLAVFGIVSVNPLYVEFLIPITILATAVFHLFTAGKSAKTESISFVSIVTLFFGIIHGLGFSNYFKAILPGSASDKLLPLLEFALGIEAAQIIVVLIVLILAYVVQTFFRFSKRDWALVMSAFIMGVVVPMIIENEIWKR